MTEMTAELQRELEAMLMVADQPYSVVTLASALDVPIVEVTSAIEVLVADYNGESDGPQRGFELREVGGGWRFYVREAYDHAVTKLIDDQVNSQQAQFFAKRRRLEDRSHQPNKAQHSCGKPNAFLSVGRVELRKNLFLVVRTQFR